VVTRCLILVGLDNRLLNCLYLDGKQGPLPQEGGDCNAARRLRLVVKGKWLVARVNSSKFWGKSLAFHGIDLYLFLLMSNLDKAADGGLCEARLSHHGLS